MKNISVISSNAGGVMFMTLNLSFIGLVLMLGVRPVYVNLNKGFFLNPLAVLMC